MGAPVLTPRMVPCARGTGEKDLPRGTSGREPIVLRRGPAVRAELGLAAAFHLAFSLARATRLMW
jgi:hypothetical protein